VDDRTLSTAVRYGRLRIGTQMEMRTPVLGIHCEAAIGCNMRMRSAHIHQHYEIESDVPLSAVLLMHTSAAVALWSFEAPDAAHSRNRRAASKSHSISTTAQP